MYEQIDWDGMIFADEGRFFFFWLLVFLRALIIYTVAILHTANMLYRCCNSFHFQKLKLKLKKLKKKLLNLQM